LPEELSIALVVVLILGWIIVKVLQALASGLNEASEAFSQSLTKKRQDKSSQRKANLARNVRVFLPNELEEAQLKIAGTLSEFTRFQSTAVWTPQRPSWAKQDFVPLVLATNPENAHGELNARDLDAILRPEATTWVDKEANILGQSCEYSAHPPKSILLDFEEFAEIKLLLQEATFESDFSKVTTKQIAQFFQYEQKIVAEYNHRRSALLSECDELNKRIHDWNIENHKRWTQYAEITKGLGREELSKFKSHRERYSRQCQEQKERIGTMAEGFRVGSPKHVIARVDHVLGSLTLPSTIPRNWAADFDEEQKILIVEVALPDVVHRPPVKTVFLKSGPVSKPLNQTEKRELTPQIHPAILLRFAYELFRNDDAQTIKLLVINGWVEFDDPKTGLKTRAYTASLMVEQAQVESLNLTKLDPLTAFESLNGKSAGRLVDIIPIEPALSLNKNDSRFVDPKAVLNMLGTATNLAAMDWQDFEHLIRELFEKEFVGRGAEVKITQASRDRGVDAIAFDPDPIHGGKYVIQAKRYTNTVDVSAVRDLCAVVRKEGASRGILVTTSTYGADAFAFANNEPVTLMNGAELLGLLKKHGYSFRINLDEARKLHSASSPK
jgi:hypothetical protein